MYYILDDTPSSSGTSRKLDFCSVVDKNIPEVSEECETAFPSSPNVLALPLDSKTPSNYYFIYLSYVLLFTLLIILISTNSFVR